MRLPLRRAVFWVHLAAGVLVGTVVALMAATGVLLAFEEQITTWADRQAVGPLATAPRRLPPSRLLAAAAAAVPGAAPTRLQVFADPRRPAEVRFGRRHTLLVDPWSGRVLGGGATGVRRAFDAVTALHRWLGGEGEWRAAGRAVTGAANLAFAALVLTGLYLWVPPLLDRRRLRSAAWFRRGLSGRARDYNWHRVIGVWLALPLLVIVLSGAVISYPWAGALIARLAGDEAGAVRRRAAGPAPAPAAGPFDPAALNPAWRAVAAGLPGWTSLRLDVPEPGATAAGLTVQHGGRGRPDLRREARIDLSRGTVAALTGLADEGRGRRIRSWLRWIHTGEAGGLAGQALAALASAGALVLVWTGWALAWRRLVRFRRRSRTAPPVPVPVPVKPHSATGRPPRRPPIESLEEMS